METAVARLCRDSILNSGSRSESMGYAAVYPCGRSAMADFEETRVQDL